MTSTSWHLSSKNIKRSPSTTPTFPLLPAGQPLLPTVALADVPDLEAVVASLASGLLVVEGPTTRGAICVHDREVVGAVAQTKRSVRVDDAAVTALTSSKTGSLSTYGLPDDVVLALPLLWRLAVRHEGIAVELIHLQRVVERLVAAEAEAAVHVQGADEAAVILIEDGTVVAAYTSADHALRPTWNVIEAAQAMTATVTIRCGADALGVLGAAAAEVEHDEPAPEVLELIPKTAEEEEKPVGAESLRRELVAIAESHLGSFSAPVTQLLQAAPPTKASLRGVVERITPAVVRHMAIQTKVPAMVEAMRGRLQEP